ncbi:MAG TPA: ATP synthase delta/epsilon chain alpha-helix domain-containing protein, partial [Anaerolineales bacterium]|nr:ATP synthase delta/epsilon chain alpha-helix domain-containing protein [Anaerolineales bacterium]
EVQPDIVTILADAAENIQDIDVTRAQAAKKRAEDALSKLKPEDHDAYLTMEAALKRSTLRLDVVQRYRKSRDVYTDKDASM